jgi:ABC-type amino acid transport substrate-binding protein/serine phosphatase RsbU (regulator of sigma subunit)
LKRILLVIIIFFGAFSNLHSQPIELTEEEKDWLKYHPVIYHGYDASWQPIEFIDENGKYAGIASGVLRLLEKKLNVKFEPKKCDSWDDAMHKLKRKEVLILPALMENEERSQFMVFTKPYQEFGFVIITQAEGEFVGGITDLIGKKLALPKGYYITNLLKTEYPELTIIEEDGVENCLMAVSTNKADATIGNLAVVSYFLNYKGFQNLKIACPTAVSPIKIAIGISKREPMLQSILQKGLNSISTKEMNAIVQDWVSVRFEHGVDMDEVWRKVYIGIGIVLIIIFLIFMWNRYLKKQIRLRKKAENELKESLSKINEQKLLIEEKNNEVMDSIMYAKRIQDALLPSKELFESNFKESFVLYLPKDIVAGDFYWLDIIDEYKFIAAADCTGHGVPGAMVSVVCHNALHRSVMEFGLREPGEILDKTREIVINMFSKYDKNIKDGMDVALLVFNEKTKELKYAGANNSLYQIHTDDKLLHEIKADKQPVGIYAELNPFTTHLIDLSIGPKIYLFSDGYADQFGGTKGKKLKYKEFKNKLVEISGNSYQNQHDDLKKTFEEWRGDFEQIDDVLVMAFDFGE